MVYGVNQEAFFILPMLGKHPDEYPRFRDCFIGKQHTDGELDCFGSPIHKHGDEKLISVFTRVGGGNREGYEKEIEELRNMPEYIEDYDDDYDPTYATFVFKVPEVFTKDFELIVEDKIEDTSEEYKAKLYSIYPELSEEFDELFK